MCIAPFFNFWFQCWSLSLPPNITAIYVKKILQPYVKKILQPYVKKILRDIWILVFLFVSMTVDSAYGSVSANDGFKEAGF